MFLRNWPAVRATIASSVLGVALAALPVRFATADNYAGRIPLMDMSPGQTYFGYPGGLYPSCTNVLTGGHLAGGLRMALQIRPLDSSGQPSAQGRIVLLSIGMSNTSQESSAFAPLFDAYADRNPRVTFINGAQGGQTAAIISNPNATFWNVVDQRLAQAGLTPLQVQAVWYKQANANPTSGFPAYADTLRDQSIAIMQIIKTRYPNTRIVYVSSRIYGGYAETPLNPEPYAYESGFAMKWLVEEQIAGNPALNFDPRWGPVRAPFVQWGAYPWADGLLPRSDGLTWVRGDFAADGTHPSQQGANKVAGLLLDFFAASPTSRIWFLRAELQQVLGDLNCDRTWSAFDIDAFLLALTDPAAYRAAFPGCDRHNADCNQDGAVNAFDIDAFVGLLLAD